MPPKLWLVIAHCLVSFVACVYWLTERLERDLSVRVPSSLLSVVGDDSEPVHARHNAVADACAR